jgi:hypothetical protein
VVASLRAYAEAAQREGREDVRFDIDQNGADLEKPSAFEFATRLKIPRAEIEKNSGGFKFFFDAQKAALFLERDAEKKKIIFKLGYLPGVMTPAVTLLEIDLVPAEGVGPIEF